jgi:hypothetical protein
MLEGCGAGTGGSVGQEHRIGWMCNGGMIQAFVDGGGSGWSLCWEGGKR